MRKRLWMRSPRDLRSLLAHSMTLPGSSNQHSLEHRDELQSTIEARAASVQESASLCCRSSCVRCRSPRRETHHRRSHCYDFNCARALEPRIIEAGGLPRKRQSEGGAQFHEGEAASQRVVEHGEGCGPPYHHADNEAGARKRTKTRCA